MVEEVVMPVNLIPLDIVDFDVILGTDWLHYNRANMDCYRKSVTFHCFGLSEVTFVSEQSGVRHAVISAVRANRLLSKGCQGYLAHVVLQDRTPSIVDDVRVVDIFLMCFRSDLPGLPPDRDVVFIIELSPSTDFML
ncbi:hypothetical protein ACFX2F_019505 [Malus domestica]